MDHTGNGEDTKEVKENRHEGNKNGESEERQEEKKDSKSGGCEEEKEMETKRFRLAISKQFNAMQ